MNREIPQLEIAVHRLGPRIGDSNDGFLQIGICQTSGFQVAAGGRAIASLRDGVTSQCHERGVKCHYMFRSLLAWIPILSNMDL